MGGRHSERGHGHLTSKGLSGNPKDVSATNSRPTTPTSPVQIPKQPRHNAAHHTHHQRQNGHRRKARDARTDAVSPSVAALLAVTDIPRPRRKNSKRAPHIDAPILVDELFDEQEVAEKGLGWSMGRSPMETLLSPPEDLEDDDVSISDSNIGSALSIRTVSMDSIPSLGDSFATDLVSSADTPSSASKPRRRMFSPSRKSLEPIRSPPDELNEHPLAESELEALDFIALQGGQLPDVKAEAELVEENRPLNPFKAVFKSNLTASLRALRIAARSFSSITFSSLSQEDLLTQSILTIDPKVPYTDERRPPVTEEIPSAEMRRYLNPTSGSRFESTPAHAPSGGKFAASIQMQTYKIQRSQKPTSHTCAASSTTSKLLPPSHGHGRRQDSISESATGQVPWVRQREMRENSDFIRIAVMEMAMRKRGKLDDNRPGRARWALPPRKSTTSPEEVAYHGVPRRWIPVTY